MYVLYYTGKKKLSNSLRIVLLTERGPSHYYGNGLLDGIQTENYQFQSYTVML